MATTTWTKGTITLTNGSATVTGDGTEWDLAELEGGETLAVVTDPPIDFSMTVQTVVGAEEIALTAPWAGATLEDVTYLITRDYTGLPANAPIPQRGDMNPWAIIGEAFRRLNNAIATVVSSIAGKLSIPSTNGLVVRTNEDGTTAARTITGTANQVIVSNGDGVSSDPTIALDASVYRQANILGSVSQSAGVPTGAIVERGSNANGEYVRFADGTQICWAASSLSSVPITTATGNSFRSDTLNLSYAATFVGVPMPIIRPSRASLSFWDIDAVHVGAPGTSSCSYRILCDSSVTINIDLRAAFIGRWF